MREPNRPHASSGGTTPLTGFAAERPDAGFADQLGRRSPMDAEDVAAELAAEDPWRGPLHPEPLRVQDLLVGLRALGADVRLDIVRLLRDERRSMQELAALLGLSYPAMSQHLQQLLDSGIVTTQRRGYSALYELRGRAITRVSTALRQLPTAPSGGCWRCDGAQRRISGVVGHHQAMRSART